MRLIVGVSILVMSLVALAGPSPSKAYSVAVKKMEEFKTQMCGCKNSACVQRISDEMTKWGQEQAKDNKEPPKMSEEETKTFTQIGEGMGKCMQKAMGGGGDMAGASSIETDCTDTQPPRTRPPAEGEVHQCYEAIKKQALDFQVRTNPSCKQCVDMHTDALAKDQAAVSACFQAVQSRPYVFTAFDPEKACAAFDFYVNADAAVLNSGQIPADAKSTRLELTKNATRQSECLDHARAARKANLLARKTDATATSLTVIRSVPPNDRTPEEAARIGAELDACRQAESGETDKLKKLKDGNNDDKGDRCETAVRNYGTLLFWRDADITIAKAPPEKRDALRKQKLSEFTARMDNGLQTLVPQCVSANNRATIECMIAAKTADEAEKCAPQATATNSSDDAPMDKMLEMMEAMGKAIEGAKGDCGKMASGLEGVVGKYERDLKGMKAMSEKMKGDKARQEEMMKKYGPRMEKVMPAMMGMMKCADDPKMKAVQSKLDGMM